MPVGMGNAVGDRWYGIRERASRSPRKLRTARSWRRWKCSIVCSAGLVVLLAFLVGNAPAGQWAWSHPIGRPVGSREWTAQYDKALLWWDLLTPLLYTALALTLVRPIQRQVDAESDATICKAAAASLTRALHPPLRRAWSGVALIVGAGLCDLVENVASLIHARDGRAPSSLILGAGGAKLMMLVLGLGLLAWGLASISLSWPGLQRAIADAERRHGTEDLDDHGDHGKVQRPDDSFAPPDGQDERVGVSLSGGGIRSASFSLGALQAISRSRIPRVDYVTSVSGGGYMAAAWADRTAEVEAEGEASGEEKRPLFLAGSEAEAHVRNNTDYLVSSPLVIVRALATVLGGMAFNLVILFVVGAAFARPLGWAVGAAHPEMGARTPIIEITEWPDLVVDDEGVRELTPQELARVDWTLNCGGCGDVPQKEGRFYAVPLRWDGVLGLGTASAADEPLTTWPVSDLTTGVDPAPGEVGPCSGVSSGFDLRCAVVLDTGTELTVLVQPGVSVSSSLIEALHGGDVGEGQPLEVLRQPRLRPRDEASGLWETSTAGDEDEGTATAVALGAALEVEVQPVLKQRSGTVGRGPVSYPMWMVLSVGLVGLLACGAALADRMLRRCFHGRHRATRALLGGTAALASVLFVLPWLTRVLTTLPEKLPGWDTLATGWGALGSFGLAAVGVVLRVKKGLGDRGQASVAGRSSSTNGIRGTRFWRHIPDLAIGVFTVGALALILAHLVDLSAANGPFGRLPALPERKVISLLPDDWWARSDLSRWVLGFVILAVLTWVPSMAWSLRGYYRARLSAAYLPWQTERYHRGGSDDGSQGSAPPRPLDQVRIRLGNSEPPVGGDEPQTEWVICTTANIRNAGTTAPGRRAGSFTFSREWVGGPEVGWMRTPEYLERLSPGRKRDVGVGSLIAISGAAFSPAMGKDSKGWLGRVFAVVNLRLGSWITNPAVLAGRRPSAQTSAGALADDVGRLLEIEGLVDGENDPGKALRLARGRLTDLRDSTRVSPGTALVMLHHIAVELSRVLPAVEQMAGLGEQEPPMVRLRASCRDLTRRRRARSVKRGRLVPPGVTWYLREVFGAYDASAKYLYLTDGGHWENLGLVELLRRGCTEIWMVSAAGDGVQSFETLGQALALGREELGVIFEPLDLQDLRPSGEPDRAAARPLLRGGRPVATAKEGHVIGRFYYPDESGNPEANVDFPDISTGYQMMSARDFEAYRMLGYVQTVRAIHDSDMDLWPDPDDPVLRAPQT